MTLAEIVACAILAHGSHVHDAEIARVESEAFIANVQPNVSLSVLLGVAWTESRFSPTGSARDRASHHFGVFQIYCDPHGPIDCDTYLDSATNIRRGAALLALRYRQVQAEHRASLRSRHAWVAAFYRGSVPATRRRSVVRQYYAYAGRVAGAQRLIAGRMTQCQRAQ